VIAAARDERAHQPSKDVDWVESWLFDVVHHDGSYALSIEFLLWPQRQQVAFLVSLVRPDQDLVSLVELEAPAPKPPSLEVRATGLWTDIGIQTPLDHMTVDIEAFAVALDDPNEVFHGAYGIRTALGCELEWETVGVVWAGPSPNSYEVPCIGHGELLVDEQTIEIDGWGWRSHRWGSPSRGDRSTTRGRTADGVWFNDPHEERAATMQVVGAAPAPAPELGARMEQFFAIDDKGDMAWIRRIGDRL
jgi:hypothetical protein